MLGILNKTRKCYKYPVGQATSVEIGRVLIFQVWDIHQRKLFMQALKLPPIYLQRNPLLPRSFTCLSSAQIYPIYAQICSTLHFKLSQLEQTPHSYYFLSEDISSEFSFSFIGNSLALKVFD